MLNYLEAIEKINIFLTTINNSPTLNPELFQGVFIKELSNSNLIYANKYSHKDTKKKTNQSHIDLTNSDALDFFFENNSSQETVYEEIILDILSNNYHLLEDLDVSEEYIFINSHKKECLAKKRRIPPDYSFSNSDHTILNAHAYKKLNGHNGTQNQINRLKTHDVFFDFLSHVYANDLLIFFKYSLNHYLVLTIPTEFSSDITTLLPRNRKNHVINNNDYSSKVANKEYQKLIKNTLPNEINYIEKNIERKPNLTGEEKEILIKSRIGQGVFRQQLINNQCKCCLCNITLPSVLRASHIKEWSDSSPKERMDINNGLLLCANHDALFDRHLISFNPENHQICISSNISPDMYDLFNLSSTFELAIPKRMIKYMRAHYNKFCTKETQ